MAAPNGSVLSFDGPTRVETDPDLAAGVTCLEFCDGVDGEVPPDPPTAFGKLKAWIRTKSGFIAGGVRGTVFQFAQDPCSLSESSAINTLEVAEGHAVFRLPGLELDVRAGKKARGCEGCSNPRSATCDCDVNACDRAGGKRLLCPNQDPHTDISMIKATDGKAIKNCVIKGSVCCNRENGAFGGACAPFPEGPAICQCAGKSTARCASTNSVCTKVTALMASEVVVDCGYGTGASVCKYDAYEVCRTPESYSKDDFGDLNSRGGCGVRCPQKKPNTCNKEECMNCRRGRCLDCARAGMCKPNQIYVIDPYLQTPRCCLDCDSAGVGCGEAPPFTRSLQVSGGIGECAGAFLGKVRVPVDHTDITTPVGPCYQ